MTNEEIIRELKNVEKEYENKLTPTFSINISSMARDCRQHIEQLSEELKKEKILNSVIKQRLVEVNCDCNEEKKRACPMFPEYCEGEHKTVVDLLTLVSDGLNETLLKQKDDEISQLKEKIFNLENKQGDVITSLSN